MVNPQFVEEQSITLSSVKKIMSTIEKRDEELNYRSGKAKDYLENFTFLSEAKQKELKEKLEGLDLTRLKAEHITKISDFMPETIEDLRTVLQAYPLSMPKKDEEAIVKVVKEFV